MLVSPFDPIYACPINYMYAGISHISSAVTLLFSDTVWNIFMIHNVFSCCDPILVFYYSVEIASV